MNKIILPFFLFMFLLPVPVQGGMDGRAVEFVTQDGWNIAAVYKPAKSEEKTVLLLHDVSKSHADFTTFADKIASKGLGYLALDLRGHGKSMNKGAYSSFAKEGVDNDYNKMVRDVNAAMEYLKSKGVAEEEVFLVGAGMGANVAAKAASFWPSVNGVALITPVTNFRDVLPIAALRVYKGHVFVAAAADDKKTFLEASVIRNVAFLSSGEGKVTFATAYDRKAHDLLDRWISAELLQWLQIPQKPDLKPDVVEPAEDLAEEEYTPIAPSSTEEALIPSVLE